LRAGKKYVLDKKKKIQVPRGITGKVKANVIIITSTKLCNYNVFRTTFCSSGECCDSFGVDPSPSFVVLSVSSGKGSCSSSKGLRKTMLMFKIQAIKEWKRVDED